MCSDRKAASNRRNAAKSTGPRTAAGRKAVRRNALKHGLAAHQVVFEFGEDAEAFRAMAYAHRAAFGPRNDVEHALVNTFSVAAWVRQRCVITEAWMTNQYIRQNQGEQQLDPAEASEFIRRLAFDPRKEADNVRRYEGAAIRRMSRACADFIRLRDAAILDEDAEARPAAAAKFEISNPKSEQHSTPKSEAPNAGVAASGGHADTADRPSAAMKLELSNPAVAVPFAVERTTASREREQQD